MADTNTQQEPRAPDDSDTNTARQGKVKRGKTRDAFAFRDFKDDTLFDFTEIYSMGKESANARSQMKKKCFEGLYKLSELGRLVTKQVARHARYQEALFTAKTLFDEPDDTPIKMKILRSSILGNYYGDLALRIRETEKEIEYLIEEIDITERQNFVKVFSARLRSARKSAGLTQEELAKQLGVKRSTYGQFEQGRNEPNVSLLPLLSRVLNRPASWFLGE